MIPLPVMGAANCSDVQRQNSADKTGMISLGHYDKTVRPTSC